jgi:mono/diheme cytochrome c family protein
MRRWILGMVIAVVFAIILLIVGFTELRIDALQEPGHLETIVATRAKHILIHRSSRNDIAQAPANRQSSLREGEMLFGGECAACHGADGHTLTDAGRWMYPRAADLTSPEVQQYSDRDLFWIVKNGVRFSGMPAFGRIESDENIWDLVQYVRTLPGSTRSKGGGVAK